MRKILILTALASVLLAACGTTHEKTVVITPPAGSTTVVHSDGQVETHR
jgi:uncharacterized lipoprotein YajG